MRDPHTGFALLSQEQRRIVAASGGAAAHAAGKAHKWTLDDARAAGRKGGLARAASARLARQEALDRAKAAGNPFVALVGAGAVEVV